MLIEQHTIAIYGLSISTQELLEQLENKYDVVGLLDGYRQSGNLYGKPIISMEQAIENNVEAVIVVARPGSRRIIVNRIREICEQHNIKVYDIHGNSLLESASKNNLSKVIAGVKEEELLKRIEENEVISFDIFDTLITRTVLYPTDVFELVEQRIVLKYGQGYEFGRKRQEAERELSLIGTPTIYDIYKELESVLGLSKLQLKEIMEIELQTEMQILVPRYDMCHVFQYALEREKKVYFVSDMYYPAECLKLFLDKLGIIGYEGLFVSCDYGTTKGKELFQRLKEIEGDTRYLHIGDNYLSDIIGAKRYGIETAWIRAGIDLFESYGWSERFAECSGLEDRVKLGMFVSRMFNSPFVLGQKEPAITKPAELGYLFFAPILTQYSIWLYSKLKQNVDLYLLLGARDGFLLKRLLDELPGNAEEKNMKNIYFLISRVCAVNAGIVQEKDVKALAKIAFGGSLKEVLRLRFGLLEEDLTEIADEEEITVEAILRYKDVIIQRALKNRANYLSYIGSLNVGERVAFSDFVSTGTCHLSLEKIMNQRIKGYYFMKVKADDPEKEKLDVDSFYGAEENQENKKIYEDYFVLENILTSPMPSLLRFEENGNPLYVNESRTKEEIEFVMQVQDGIVDYFKQYLSILPQLHMEKNKKCSELLFELLHSISVDNEVFRLMEWDDNFYSRKSKVKDLM